DWRTLKGQWVPRPLETIARSKFGDCKDFAVSVATILKSIGIDARVAWVLRGWGPVLDSYRLPSLYRFNHAIVHLNVGDRVYWLDGTNVASFAQGVPVDIADRPALVLDPGASELARVSRTPTEDFSYSFHQGMDFSGGDGVRVEGAFSSRGADASSWI